MVRGTTPPFKCKIKDDSPINLKEVQNLHFTISQGANSITKSGTDVEVQDDCHTVLTYLTQEESLSLSDRQTAKVQLNWLYEDENGVLRRGGTKVKEIEIDEQLFRKVIE